MRNYATNIYFTTLQKFGLSRAEKRAGAEHPLLSDRRNIIVIADEAHRSHYDDLDGYARHLKDALPNAVLIAFTGTPISSSDRNTRQVFGDHIHIYDLSRAVEDGATVPVHFEPRALPVKLAEQVSEEALDQAADEATTGLDDAERTKIEQAVAQINMIYGAPERIAALATDIVKHWETRSAAMHQFLSGPGKALIVCNTREICAKLSSAITKLRRDWHDDAVDKGVIYAVHGLTNHLRSPHTPGNQVDPGEESLGVRFRRLSNQLARAWALCSGNDTLDDRRQTAGFFEETRKWMAKFDARERQAEGKPVPEDIERMLASLVAESTGTADVIDIYAAAGLPKPSLSELTLEFQQKAHKADNPHLAIEALRSLINAESARVTRHNLVRQRAFSERITELMRKYTNQQLSSAEVIAELIAMANELAAEGNRGTKFDPPLGTDELAFYDVVSTNESAVDLQGEDVLAQIARELVGVMKRDVKTDWTVRNDVRAKLRSSVKRLLVKHKYPPDKQPEAIKLVIEQMETMAMRDAMQVG